MSDEFAINRLNGWDRSMRIVRTYWPDLTHLTDFSDSSSHPVHREVLAAWESLPDMVKLGADVWSPMVAATSPDKEAPISRHALTDSYAANQFGDISASLDQRGRLLLHLSAESGAGAWLDVYPRFPESRLSDSECRIAVQLWLHAPLSNLGGAALAADPSGRTALRSSTAERIASHDGVKVVLCDALVESGHRTYPEVPGLYGPHPGNAEGDRSGADRRLDWWASLLASGKQITGDVCRVDGATDAWLRHADILQQPLQAAIRAEKGKVTKYDSPGDRPVGTTFYACAVGTQCELGPGAQAFVTYLATQLALRASPSRDHPDPKAVARHKLILMQRIGIALMRGQAIQILATVNGQPFHAVAQAKRHVHSSFWRSSTSRRAGGTCCCGAPTPRLCRCCAS